MKARAEIRSEFRLRRFESAIDPDFIEGLRIYGETTRPEIKGSTNDFVYWIERYEERFKGDHLFFLGFYSEGKVIGFVLTSYLSSTKLLIVDHVAIASDYRKNDAFFVLAEQIRAFVRGLGLDVSHVVAEIDSVGGVGSGMGGGPTEGQLLTRLLKLIGFKVAKALYYQLPLGDKNPVSERRLTLMIRTYAQGSISELPRDEYLRIVHSIYFEHYLRWYKDLLPNVNAYEQRTKRLYSEIEASLQRNATVLLNGHHSDGILEGQGPTAKSPTELLTFLIPGVALVLVVTGFMAALVLLTGIDPISAGIFVLFALTIVVVIASLISPTARSAMEGIFKILKSVFGIGK